MPLDKEEITGAEILSIYKILWEHSLIGIALIDEDGKLLAANSTFCSITGYNEHEVLHKNYRDIVHPEDWEEYSYFINAFDSKNSDAYELQKRFLTKPGGVVWVVSRTCPIVVDEELMCLVTQVSESLNMDQCVITEYPSGEKKVTAFKKTYLRDIWESWSLILMILSTLAAAIGYIIVQISEYVKNHG